MSIILKCHLSPRNVETLIAVTEGSDEDTDVAWCYAADSELRNAGEREVSIGTALIDLDREGRVAGVEFICHLSALKRVSSSSPLAKLPSGCLYEAKFIEVQGDDEEEDDEVTAVLTEPAVYRFLLPSKIERASWYALSRSCWVGVADDDSYAGFVVRPEFRPGASRARVNEILSRLNSN